MGATFVDLERQILAKARHTVRHSARDRHRPAARWTPQHRNWRFWNNEDMPMETTGAEAAVPICPNCRQPLRENLRHERLDAQSASESGPSSRIAILYCGVCGWSLHVEPVPTPFMTAGGPAGMEVAAPADETTLDGQFQLRSRDLITEIRALGFDPFVWVGLINDLGAVRAAKSILADHGILPVTHWLVDRGLPELTLEREIEQMRWADLFDEADLSKAARRLASAGSHNPNQ
jgi:hypothetical protein